MTQAKRPLGAQIAHALKERGVDTVFGVPGVHNIELYRGLEEAGIRHVLARHEQGAGFMADGYARASGRPGVAFTITGPGLCNIMTPMGQAYSDSVPMLVISSCLGRQRPGRQLGRLHEMRDQESAAEAVCAWSRTATDPAGTYQLLDKAFNEFGSQRGRPVHIQIPVEVLSRKTDPAPAYRCRRHRLVPDPDQIEEVAKLMQAAVRPMLILGGGARRAKSEARALVAVSGCAVFPTCAGRGIVPETHPLSFGANLAQPDSVRYIAQADLVIAVGTELGETDLWRSKLGHVCPLVRVDIDQNTLADSVDADIQVLSDAKAFLGALVKQAQRRRSVSDWNVADIARAVANFQAATDADRPGIVQVAAAMRAALPKDTTIYSDMTQFAYAASETYEMEEPGRWHHPSGFGTLGYALPAAIGGKLALGRRPVVCIAGDYGFQFTLPELAVAVEKRLSLPVVLWDNDGLKEIEGAMIDSQIEPSAVRVSNPDFLRLAEAFGAKSCCPGNLREFQSELRAALAEKRPTVIRATPALSNRS
ncbi:MAG: 5-guanidino-2-oxopentanoate decarboxylase [Paracoccaceae bacterium]